jgi:hypothetical protein
VGGTSFAMDSSSGRIIIGIKEGVSLGYGDSDFGEDGFGIED